MNFGNNYHYKNMQCNTLHAILMEQEEKQELDKINKVSKVKAPEKDKNKIFYDINKNKVKKQNKKIATKEAVSSYFMNILLTKLYEESCVEDIKTPDMDLIRKNIVANFIKENGAINIRNTMSKKSFMLKTICEAEEAAELETEKYNKKIIHEEIPREIKDNIKTLLLSDQSDFLDKELKNEDSKYEFSDIADHVRNYVSNSIEQFIINNIDDKEKIKNVLTDVKNKIDSINSTNEELDKEIKESAIKLAKQKTHKIENRKKSLLESIVRHLSKKALTTKNKNLMLETGNINIDKIVKISEAMMTMIVLSEAIGFELDEKSVKAQFL